MKIELMDLFNRKKLEETRRDLTFAKAQLSHREEQYGNLLKAIEDNDKLITRYLKAHYENKYFSFVEVGVGKKKVEVTHYVNVYDVVYTGGVAILHVYENVSEKKKYTFDFGALIGLKQISKKTYLSA